MVTLSCLSEGAEGSLISELIRCEKTHTALAYAQEKLTLMLTLAYPHQGLVCAVSLLPLHH